MSAAFRVALALLYMPPSLGVLCALAPLRYTLQPVLRHIFKVPNNNLPSDVIQRIWTKIFLKILGVEVEVRGRQFVEPNKPCIFMMKHASNLDPFIILGASPQTVRFIGKRELFLIPLFGWAAFLYGHIPIDRNKRDDAVESLQAAGRTVHEHGRAIAISPEGTRSTNGRTKEFKKGPFYLVKESGVDIIPCACFGAYELWPPNQTLPQPGRVVLQFGPRIRNDASVSREKLAEDVQTAFLKFDAEFYGTAVPAETAVSRL
eukprot:TRINITY_DN7518_c0_g1_i1.p1 TRINITY_DN7518_c0_g1~~TRINITY_DN7518_c0_g1_i1.p1  ORF type:complete len:261 (-),score=56.45 TRINITY_DN7518_c0_g1_i1:37-819(-)